MKKITAGVDEVGRGSLVGPVYAAAVILNKKIDKKKCIKNCFCRWKHPKPNNDCWRRPWTKRR